jgi:tetratricopeptide (TPR) repeat protein
LLIGLISLSAPHALSDGQEAKISEEEIKKFEGNYKIDVHPDPFGFFVKDGKLWLKMGGLEGSGQTVPLIYVGDGKFKIAPDHANEFGFKVEGGEVKFTLYAMGNAIPGHRLEEKQAEPGKTKTEQVKKSSDEPRKGEKNRGDILAEIKQVEPQFKINQEDKKLRFKYGKLLYQAGDFWKAQDVIGALAKSEDVSVDALDLAAKLAYLTGNYDKAEKLFDRLIKATEGKTQKQVMAKVGQFFTYYQTNQFSKVKGLNFPAGVQLPNAKAMEVFVEEPYQMEWTNEDKVATVPFLMTDPLPVLTIEFNGVPVQVFFDTGGDTFILDNEIAEALGIEWVAKAMGSFGGGKQAEVGFGKVDSVKLGEVTLKQVPITILPTKRFSDTFQDGRYTIGGVIGTAALRQFLSTIDYKNERLIFRERTEANAQKLRNDLKGRIADEVPFVLALTHMMMVKGSLNDRDGLTYFVDSGLAGDEEEQPSFTAPIQTLKYAGIPEPERKVSEESTGGGGGVWASGAFPIKKLGMGKLIQTDVMGEYGSRTPDTYWSRGFIQDGLISHAFLRQYSSWTLDFDSMTYIFEK